MPGTARRCDYPLFPALSPSLVGLRNCQCSDRRGVHWRSLSRSGLGFKTAWLVAVLAPAAGTSLGASGISPLAEELRALASSFSLASGIKHIAEDRASSLSEEFPYIVPFLAYSFDKPI